MENPSIYDVFERMWQYIIGKFNNYANIEDLDNHIVNKENPHKVTAEQVGVYTKEEIDELVTVEDIDNICGSSIVYDDVVTYATEQWVSTNYQLKGDYANMAYVANQIDALRQEILGGAW